MTFRWEGAPVPKHPRPGPLGWTRVAGRGSALALMNFGGLALLLLMRPAERICCAGRRPLTGPFVVRVCRWSLRILGLRHRLEGDLAPGPVLVAANHVSWLDIFALNACAPVIFVAKLEVATWPGIGWLARATGTLFIARDRRATATAAAALASRLARGDRLVLFAEGTSSDGLRVLPFRAPMFAGVEAGGVPVQPVSLRYAAPPGLPDSFFGWWGSMDFLPHLVAVLAAPGAGRVTIRAHPVLASGGTPDRKQLARRAEAAVRCGHDALATGTGR